MSEIKSKKAIEYLNPKNISQHDIGVSGSLITIDIMDAEQAIIIAEQEAEECYVKTLQELIDKVVITMGAMILDGYELEDSCIKYMKELINDFKELTNELIIKKDK